MRKRYFFAATALVMSIGLTACVESNPDKKTEEAVEDIKDIVDSIGDAAEDAADEVEDAIDSIDTETSSDFTMDGAEVKEWGDYTVSVPSGWTFREGDAFDDTDKRYCSVKKGDLYYIDFIMDENEDTIMNSYNYNKNTYTNEQVDVSGTYGDIAWTGFQYSDGFGGHGCELYSTVGKKFVRIASTFGFDSPEVKGILESLKIKE